MSTTSTKMVVPDTITVGFQKRDDTYTGKLAYIIYTDSKGVLRKEGSWQSWRDKKIEPITFKNTPQADFVLNKKVGGYRMDWNHRQTYVRVYDSRDFEFEITVPNLLFILQETSAIKGKGLDGECVYAWNGKDLFLLPTACKEYQECVNFTKAQAKKVDKADKVPGNIFLMKDMAKVMYLGRHQFAEVERYTEPKTHKPVGLKHVFKKLDEVAKDEDKYIALDGFTKISERLSAEVSPDYDMALMSFKRSKYSDEAVAVRFVPSLRMQDSYYGDNCFVKIGDRHYPAKRFQERNGRYGWHDSCSITKYFNCNDQAEPIVVNGKVPEPMFPGDYRRYGSSDNDIPLKIEHKLITNEQFFDAMIVTKKGHQVKLTS